MNWGNAKLNEICTLINGRAYKKHELLENGKYPVMRVGNFFSNREWYYSDLELPEKNYCEKGDLLYAWSASFGPRIWEGEKSIYHYHIWKLELDESKVDKRFLLYALERDVEKIKSEQGSGSTMIHVTKTAMENREIPLPYPDDPEKSLKEQKRIAAILDKADGIRRKRQQAIQLADEFLRSVFLDMFGDPVTNPKGWEVKVIEELCAIQGGLQVSKKRAGLGLKVPYLRVANVLRNKLELDEIKEIELTNSELSRVQLKADDILVVEGHGNANEIGRCAIWNGAIEGVVHQNHLIRVRIKAENIRSRFVNDYLNSPGGRVQMMKASNTTSGLNTISTSIVKSTKILFPPVELQDKYIGIVERVNGCLNLKITSKSEIDEAFHSLSQKVFKGEL